MGWESEHNRNSRSPHGNKASEAFATRGLHDAKCVPCPDMPPGILGAPLNADPHAAGPKANPYVPESSRRPRGEPVEMKPPHNPAPHPYGGDRKEPNTYGLSRLRHE